MPILLDWPFRSQLNDVNLYPHLLLEFATIFFHFSFEGCPLNIGKSLQDIAIAVCKESTSESNPNKWREMGIVQIDLIVIITLARIIIIIMIILKIIKQNYFFGI